jgi:hypothetical protein
MFCSLTIELSPFFSPSLKQRGGSLEMPKKLFGYTVLLLLFLREGEKKRMS